MFTVRVKNLWVLENITPSCIIKDVKKQYTCCIVIDHVFVDPWHTQGRPTRIVLWTFDIFFNYINIINYPQCDIVYIRNKNIYRCITMMWYIDIRLKHWFLMTCNSNTIPTFTIFMIWLDDRFFLSHLSIYFIPFCSYNSNHIICTR